MLTVILTMCKLITVPVITRPYLANVHKSHIRNKIKCNVGQNEYTVDDVNE